MSASGDDRFRIENGELILSREQAKSVPFYRDARQFAARRGMRLTILPDPRWPAPYDPHAPHGTA